MDKDKEPEIFRRSEEFLGVFRKGVEFTQELLKENERLRFSVVRLTEQLKVAQERQASPDVATLQHQVNQLTAEREALLNKYRLVEEENKDFANRYMEVEEENNNLANLYVASYQLHSTLDFAEIVRIVSEIILNLVGSDHFAILVRDDDTPAFTVVASEGVDPGLTRIRLGEGAIGKVGETGETYIQEDLEHATTDDPHHPVVCIPLKIHDQVIGMIAIFSLLEQKKKRLTRVDHELFSMLAGHAATAIFSAKMYSRTEQKLSTIKGFIGLISGKPDKDGDHV